MRERRNIMGWQRGNHQIKKEKITKGVKIRQKNKNTPS